VFLHIVHFSLHKIYPSPEELIYLYSSPEELIYLYSSPEELIYLYSSPEELIYLLDLKPGGKRYEVAT